MKVVILAGGFGTRISEETSLRPKPMVEIGDMPIIWHIMKIYSHYGFNDFVICLGYKGYIIKEFFVNYFLHSSDIIVDLKNNSVENISSPSEDWKISLINTGEDVMTGGRIKRIAPYIGNEPFMLTYGDGVANIDIKELLRFHKKTEKYCTVTSVQPLGRFGSLDINQNALVNSFQEKPKGDGSWISGGFFVCQPEVFNYLQDDQTIFERAPMESLASEGQLAAYKHQGFWKPMDTLRDKNELEQLWSSGNAPWKMWS